MNERFKLNDILEAASLADKPYRGIQIVEITNWEQDHISDNQLREIIFYYAPNDAFYRYDQGRSGSAYTEWTYDDDNTEFVDCQRVKMVEKVTHYWQAV